MSIQISAGHLHKPYVQVYILHYNNTKLLNMLQGYILTL